jgi:hypothetical protein
MCTVLLPPGVNPIAVDKYIDIKYQITNCFMRSAPFRDVTRRVVAIPYRRFVTTYRPHPQGSIESRREPVTVRRAVCIARGRVRVWVVNCHYTLRNTPEEPRYHLLSGRGLKSRKLPLVVAVLYLDVIAGTSQLLLNELI